MSEGVQLARSRRLSHGEQLARSARKYPDRTAFRGGDQALTYAQLDVQVDLVAAGLADLGFRRGDRVAIVMRNRAEFVVSFYACCRIAAVAVPVNFRLAPPELAHIFADAGAAVIICEAEFADKVGSAIDQLGSRPLLVVVGGDDAGYRHGSVVPYETLGTGDVVRARRLHHDVDVDEQEALCILYTSGTTGLPKGAVLTHMSMLAQSLVRAHAQRLGVDGPEVWLSGLQLFHVGGLCSLLPSVLLGGEFIMLERDGTDAARIADLLERHAVTTCSLVPTQWAQVCASAELTGRHLALRRISWGASRADDRLLARLAVLFPHVQVFNLFGQTETSGVTCTLPGGEAIECPGSVGRPLLGVEARLVDDQMCDVADGEVGEIVYRGPTLMREYWGNPEATELAFAGGWLHSGDLAVADDAGRLWIVDRKTDVIISAGENIYPAEVEAAIATHPQVAEVAVVGIPDSHWGETPVAVIVPADPADPPDLATVRAHCADRIALFKRPTALALAVALPRNAAGKVQKFRLRDDLAAGTLRAVPITPSTHRHQEQ
jgi:acyl-CoA synthetase (AMP-forming)/AMP-acid ligase II